MRAFRPRSKPQLPFLGSIQRNVVENGTQVVVAYVGEDPIARRIDLGPEGLCVEGLRFHDRFQQDRVAHRLGCAVMAGTLDKESAEQGMVPRAPFPISISREAE
jgi:hypothetical protein